VNEDLGEDVEDLLAAVAREAAWDPLCLYDPPAEHLRTTRRRASVPVGPHAAGRSRSAAAAAGRLTALTASGARRTAKAARRAGDGAARTIRSAAALAPAAVLLWGALVDALRPERPVRWATWTLAPAVGALLASVVFPAGLAALRPAVADEGPPWIGGMVTDVTWFGDHLPHPLTGLDTFSSRIVWTLDPGEDDMVLTGIDVSDEVTVTGVTLTDADGDIRRVPLPPGYKYRPDPQDPSDRVWGDGSAELPRPTGIFGPSRLTVHLWTADDDDRLGQDVSVEPIFLDHAVESVVLPLERVGPSLIYDINGYEAKVDRRDGQGYTDWAATPVQLPFNDPQTTRQLCCATGFIQAGIDQQFTLPSETIPVVAGDTLWVSLSVALTGDQPLTEPIDVTFRLPTTPPEEQPSLRREIGGLIGNDDIVMYDRLTVISPGPVHLTARPDRAVTTDQPGRLTDILVDVELDEVADIVDGDWRVTESDFDGEVATDFVLQLPPAVFRGRTDITVALPFEVTDATPDDVMPASTPGGEEGAAADPDQDAAAERSVDDALRVGDCVQWPDGPFRQLRHVACDVHQGQVVHVYDPIDSDSVPHGALRARASAACRQRWPAFTGRPYDHTPDSLASIYFDRLVAPTATEYERGETAVVCIAVRFNYNYVRGEIRGSETPERPPQ
jgi:hypothetical protein